MTKMIWGITPGGKRFLFGELSKDVLYRTVKTLIKFPQPAIALDVAALDVAKEQGAKTLTVQHGSNNYSASVALLDACPVREDRGAGLQIFMSLQHWASTEKAKGPQMDLFGERA